MAKQKYGINRSVSKGVMYYTAYLISDPSVSYGPVVSRLAALSGIARKVGVKTGKKKVSMKQTKLRKLFVTMCIDRSGSMHGIMRKANESLKEQLSSLQADAQKTGLDVKFRVLAFSSYLDWVVGDQALFVDLASTDIEKMSYIDAHGGTRLVDAIGAALETSPEDESSLIMTITDGQENESRLQRSDLKALVDRRVATDKVTLTFLGPRGSTDEMLRLGFQPGNCQEWEQTYEGVARVTMMNNAGLGSYTKSIASGLSSVDSFYANVGNLKSSTVKKNLDDVSTRFKTLRVDREEKIADFVKRKLGTYRKGAAYYQLSKSEKSVQSYKKILVRKKNESKIYGGEDARAVLGIPEGQDLKVKIANLGEWDIFVQSTSLNRLLVRGTDLLVES